MSTTQAPPELADAPNPPTEIMPVAAEVTAGIVPSVSIIERLTMLANAIARSAMPLPSGCRTPESIFAKMLLGYEHGIRPMTALYEIDFIDGKASLNSRTMVATIRARGIGNIEIESVGPEGCTVTVTRADWPAGRVERVSFTLDDALQGGYLVRDAKGQITSGKKNWRTHTQDMYVARAQARAYRRYFQDATLGLAYTPEELGADEEEAGRVVGVQFEPVAPPAVPSAPAAPAAPAALAAPAAPVATPAPPPAVDATAPAPAATAPRPATAEQAAEARRLAQILQLTPADWAALKARFSASASSLTAAQAESLIEFMNHVRMARQARAMLQVPDDAWAKALARRQVTRDIDLPPAEASTIASKLLDQLAPFDRQRVQSPDAPVKAEGDLGNAPSPVSSVPVVMPPSPPAVAA